MVRYASGLGGQGMGEPTGQSTGAGAQGAEPTLHQELRAIARYVLRGKRCPSLLQTTALVHEAWMRLRGFDLSRSQDRTSQFAALAAKTIRSVLIDEARRDRRVKRGKNWRRVPLSNEAVQANEPMAYVDLVDLDLALRELSQISQRRATVVELRFFAGLTVEKVAELLGVSRRTVETEWEYARAWLRVRLTSADAWGGA